MVVRLARRSDGSRNRVGNFLRLRSRGQQRRKVVDVGVDAVGGQNESVAWVQIQHGLVGGDARDQCPIQQIAVLMRAGLVRDQLPGLDQRGNDGCGRA